MKNFNELLSKLNPPQREAANTIYGAVFVVAGPGTGKTHTLTLRVLNMIQSEAMVSPETILALTYTESAATEMRTRLIEYMGADAYRINIHTFHSWCNEIITRNVEYFGIRDFEPINDLEEIQICKKLIDQIPGDAKNPLKRLKGDIYFEVNRMRNLFSKMKSEAWTADQIAISVTQYLDSLPERPEYIYKKSNTKTGVKVGDIKLAQIEKEREKLKYLIAAAEQFENYIAEMVKMRRYDFDDMLLWVKRAYEVDAGFLQTYQEKYQFVMIDEFQDTNGIQMKLIDALMSYWKDPNIFVVGDDDQALYEFNGARIKNMYDFISFYNPKVVVLKHNYRSNLTVISPAFNVIENNQIRIANMGEQFKGDFSKQPIVEMNYASEIGDSRAFEFSTWVNEQAMIVKAIEDLLKNGVNPKDIAILYRKHSQIEGIHKALLMRNIPVNVKRRINVLHSPLILWLIDILYFVNELNKPMDDKRKFLHYFAKVCMNSLSGLRTQEVEEQLLLARIANADIQVAIDKLIEETEFPQKEFFIFLQLTNLSRPYYKPLPTIESMLLNLHVLEFISKSPDKQFLFHNLHSFVAWVKGEVFKNPSMTIEDLLRLIEVLNEERISVPTVNIDFADEGVNLMTSHGSKGHEFDYVFIVGATQKQWSSAYRGGNYMIPDTLHYTTELDEEETQRRLFFVSLTRAKKAAIVSYHISDDNDKAQEPCKFLIESGLNITKMAPSKDVIIEYLTKILYKSVEFQPIAKKELITRALDNYRLSVSGVNKYLNCPVQFYYENVIRVPFVANPALIYGDSIHEALRYVFENHKNDPNMVITDALDTIFRVSLEKNRGQMNEPSYKVLLQRWVKDLIVCKGIFEFSNKITLNEYNVKMNLFDIPFTYIFDKLEFAGFNVGSVDYKTGKNSNVQDHLKPPKTSEDHGGDYWRQMTIGKMMLDRIYNKEWKYSFSRIDIIDGDDSESIVVKIEKEHEFHVEKQIKFVWDSINNHVFSPGCGECYWCKQQKNV